MVQPGDFSYGTLAPLLTDKVAVVTGGAGAIGTAICRLFAAHGADIVVSGANPTGPRNVVFGSTVQARTPEAAFGIVLAASDRSRVAFNRVNGFAGQIPGFGGGGIAVILDSNNNLIMQNIVDSDPDLFWDETGTGNVWADNQCDTSVPDGLCE